MRNGISKGYRNEEFETMEWLANEAQVLDDRPEVHLIRKFARNEEATRSFPRYREWRFDCDTTNEMIEALVDLGIERMNLKLRDDYTGEYRESFFEEFRAEYMD